MERLYVVDNAERATEIAIEQAKKAGLPSLWVTVDSAKRHANGKWIVILTYYSSRYKAEIDKSGKVIEWKKLPSGKP